MFFLDKIAEKAIAAAVARGDLDNLPGQGKPLILDDDSCVPPELRAGYRILKNAGYLPPEMTLRVEIRRVEELLLRSGCTTEKGRLVAKLSLLKSQLQSANTVKSV